MKLNKKRVELATRVGAVALAGVAIIGGASAYLTDAETAKNTFTVGKVRVDLVEPEYPGNDSEEVKELTPNQEVPKDPSVTNTGDNNAVVFLKVKVPVKEVITANNDGSREEAASKPLFIFKEEADSPVSHENNFDDAWIQLTDIEAQENTDPDAYYHIFGYSQVLEPGVTTSALFDKVQLLNVVAGEIDSSTQSIEIDVYAIQDSNLVSGDQIMDLTTLDKAELQNAYRLFFNDHKDIIASDAIKDANTGNKLDLSGKEHTN